MRCIVALGLIASVCTAHTALAQVRDNRAAAAAPANAAPVGTGSISGTVVSDGRLTPLRLATVVLIGGTTGVVKATSTDAEGKFAFSALPADRYTVGASKAPFLGAVAGAKRPARPGMPIVLRDAQRAADVVIRLPMSAAISGVVTDESGQPVQGSVLAQRRRYQNGELTLVRVGDAVVTDAQGRYRIYGLPPGEYVVTAIVTGANPFAGRSMPDREVDDALRGVLPPAQPTPPLKRALPTFYPGTVRVAEAGAIAVNAGDDRTDIDIRAMLVDSVRVEGTVTRADGKPVLSASLSLSPIDGLPYQSFGGLQPNTDRFVFNYIAPGSYILSASSSGPDGSLFGLSFIDVASDTTVRVTLSPGLTLRGRFAFDGASAAPPTAGVQLQIKSLTKGIDAPQARADAAGAFTMQRTAPGRYTFSAPLSFGPNDSTMKWSLQSIAADGQDITDLPFDISADAPPKEIVATFTDQWQSVSGKLVQASGAPATDYAVVIFPANKAYWLFGSRRILVAKPAGDGQFTFGGSGLISLPPGEYLLAAVTDIERDEQFDPSFLAQLVNAAAPVSIRLGEKKVQDLVIR